MRLACRDIVSLVIVDGIIMTGWPEDDSRDRTSVSG